MKPYEIYKRYENEIVVDEKLLKVSSNIYKDLGEKLNKTYKVVYLMMKRVYDKEIASNNGADSETSKCNVEEKTFATNNRSDIKEKSIMDSSNANPIESYTAEFQNTSIFEIESRNELHRNKLVTKNCVKTGWTTKLATFLFTETSLRTTRSGFITFQATKN